MSGGTSDASPVGPGSGSGLGAGEKRLASESIASGQLVKRLRSDVALVGKGLGSATGIPAVDSVVELSGHSGIVYSCRFNPLGTILATSSKDKEIFLWETSGQHKNIATLPGHKNAVLDLRWSPDSGFLHSASADMTVSTWDITTCERVRRHVGHEGVINCLAANTRGDRVLLTGSDDGHIGLWDPRQKDAITFIPYSHPITAVAVSEAGNEFYSGSIDNIITVWDTRKLIAGPQVGSNLVSSSSAAAYTLTGHTDTVSSLEVSPDTQTLLSYSFDGTARLWDIRPFGPTTGPVLSAISAGTPAASARLIRTLDGATGAGMDMNLARACWSAGPAGHKAAAGCSDGTVVVWDTRSGKLLQKVPGHKGAVNDVRFLPGSDSVLASASTDGTILFGPI